MTAHLPRIAVVGRPNVGKSTLFNRLAGKPLAIVDDRPGVTRDRREARGRLGDLPLLLIDTAGYDDAEKDGLDAEMRTQTEMAIHDADLCLLLIDARAGVLPADEIFADILRKRAKHVILAANKAEGRCGDGGIAEPKRQPRSRKCERYAVVQRASAHSKSWSNGAGHDQSAGHAGWRHTCVCRLTICRSSRSCTADSYVRNTTPTFPDAASTAKSAR